MLSRDEGTPAVFVCVWMDGWIINIAEGKAIRRECCCNGTIQVRFPGDWSISHRPKGSTWIIFIQI